MVVDFVYLGGMFYYVDWYICVECYWIDWGRVVVKFFYCLQYCCCV